LHVGQHLARQGERADRRREEQTGGEPGLAAEEPRAEEEKRDRGADGGQGTRKASRELVEPPLSGARDRDQPDEEWRLDHEGFPEDRRDEPGAALEDLARGDDESSFVPVAEDALSESGEKQGRRNEEHQAEGAAVGPRHRRRSSRPPRPQRKGKGGAGPDARHFWRRFVSAKTAAISGGAKPAP
jgi:hypothetical protein